MQEDYSLNQDKFYLFGLSYAVLIFALVFARGIYIFPTQLLLLSVSWLFLFLTFFKKSFFGIINKPKPDSFVLGLVILNFLLYYLFDEAYRLNNYYDNYFLFIFKLLSIIFLFFYFLKFNFSQPILNLFLGHLGKYKFHYLIAIALISRVFIITVSPEPTIDTFWFTNQGAESILNGKNPYAQEFFPVYGLENPNDKYVYWPATIIYSLPFKLFLGDVRYGYALAQILMGFLLYKLLSKKTNNKLLAEGLGLLTVYCPISLYVIDQCWSEPLSILLLYLFFVSNLLGKEKLSFIFLGFFGAVKFIYLAFIGFGFFLEKNKIKDYLISVLVLLLFITPFAVWGLNDFLKDTIVSVLKYRPMAHSLSLNSPYLLTFGQDIPSIFYLFIAFGLFIFLIKRAPKNLLGTLLSTTVLLFAIFVIKQGFVNYYYFIAQVLILLMALDFIELDKLKKDIVV